MTTSQLLTPNHDFGLQRLALHRKFASSKNINNLKTVEVAMHPPKDLSTAQKDTPLPHFALEFLPVTYLAKHHTRHTRNSLCFFLFKYVVQMLLKAMQLKVLPLALDSLKIGHFNA